MQFLSYFCFLCLFFMSYGDKCPAGTFHYGSNCFYFMKNETNFKNAELKCNNLGAHLISIHDLFTDSVLGYPPNVGEFWIGGIKKNGTWTWTDGTPFDWADWKQSEPKNDSSDAQCIMFSTHGFWYSKDCKESHGFICSVPTSLEPISCDDDWKYLNETGYCYVGYPNGNLSSAETTCKKVGAHLVSIHSKAENDFVGGWFHIDGPYHRRLYNWIGLYRQNKSSEWKWIDGTPFDYANWGQDSPRPDQNCVTQINDSPFTFTSVDCDNNAFGFLCKKLPMQNRKK